MVKSDLAMTTRTLHVSCNARPVRLAFLLDKPDPASVEELFRLNTLLWGGMLNPIVVLDGSARKQVGRHYQFPHTTYEQELLSTLEGFDPDIVINYSNVALPPGLNGFKERTFGKERLRWNHRGNEEISFFLEIWPILRQYWRKEFRFLQKPPAKFGYVDLDSTGELKTFLIARFGSYPEGNDGNSVLAANFGGQAVSYDETFRKSFNPDEWVFPSRITTFELDVHAPNSFRNYIFFLLEPTNIFDILDYWNLRAAGFRLFSLPIGHYQDFAESAKAFAENSTYPIRKDAMNWPEIIKGRSIEDSQLEDAGRWLRSLGLKANGLSLKGWVPRFEKRGNLITQEIEIRPIVSKESDEIVILSDGYGTLIGPKPDCELIGPAYSQHWATDLQVFGSSDQEHTFKFPWLHPECDKLANHLIGHGFGAGPSRVSKRGIVVIRHGDRDNVRIREPKVTQVFQSYLKDGGLTYLKASSPGLALERIIEQLGGLLGCSVLQNAGVREIIERLATGSSIPAEEARKILHKTISVRSEERYETFDGILTQLVSKKVLRQGLELQCDRCHRRDWYHLVDLGEDFKCKKCFHVQLVPFLDKRPWHYVSDGLFRLQGKVEGCLTTALSLIFLETFLEHDTKYVSSFEYADGDVHSERDFAVLASDFFEPDVDVIIGECKTMRELGEKDRTDIKLIGERTGAYLAISTLSAEFSENDKAFFRELVSSKQKPILLNSNHLDMRYMEVSTYRNQGRGVERGAELLSRLTIIDVLGKEFADSHKLWI
jgi:hypothetical protein